MNQKSSRTLPDATLLVLLEFLLSSPTSCYTVVTNLGQLVSYSSRKVGAGTGGVVAQWWKGLQFCASTSLFAFLAAQC